MKQGEERQEITEFTDPALTVVADGEVIQIDQNKTWTTSVSQEEFSILFNLSKPSEMINLQIKFKSRAVVLLRKFKLVINDDENIFPVCTLAKLRIRYSLWSIVFSSPEYKVLKVSRCDHLSISSIS